MGIHFFPNIHSDPYILGFAFLFTIIIGALTGISPAIVLSKLSIIDSIKTRVFSSGKTSKIRSTLVIYQLSVSIILIIGTLVIFQQLRYMQNKKLGYDKEHVLVLHTGFDAITQKMDVFKGLIARNLNVLNMSQSSQLPTNIITGEGINTKDGTRYESSYISVDKNFFDTMGLKVIRGKNHIAAMVAEKNPDQQTFQNLFVVNQSLLREIDVKLTEIDEHTLIIRHGNMKPGSIIGVVEDFHFTSLHAPIGPLVFEFTPDRIEYLLIKIKSDNIPGTINYIEQQWNKLAEGLPFEFHFLDEHYDALYQAEQQLSYLSIIFTLISIVIIVLGLLGLISFITTRKTKEIGIRKVMGASVENILLLLSKTFILWTIVANLIAWPFAWYTMNHWLQNFVYRIEMSWWMFALAGGIALFMTLLTVSFQTIKAAIANPIESLRYE
jgi:putative ABC transport system permease protein